MKTVVQWLLSSSPGPAGILVLRSHLSHFQVTAQDVGCRDLTPFFYNLFTISSEEFHAVCVK